MLIALLVGGAQAAEEGKSATVSGKAVSVAGQPVGGVKVTITEHQPGKAAENWSATTSAEGAFRIVVPMTSARNFGLRVDGPPDGKLAPCAVSPQTQLFVQPGQSVRLTIVLAATTAKLTGTVTDADKKAVPGVTLTLRFGRIGGWASYTATTDENGRYTFGRLAPGSYVMHSVEPQAGLTLVRLSTWKPFGVRAVTLSDGQTTTEDFQLPRGARFVGRVVGEDGKPVAGAAVSCSLDAATEEGPKQVYQMPGQWYNAEAKTDADGRYALGGLTQETYVVTAHSPEGADLAPETLRGVNAPKEGDAKLQDMVLYKAGTVLGKVLGADGKPVPGAEITLVGMDRFGAPVTMKADDAGKFTLRGLGTGRYPITIKPPEGSASCQTKFDDVTAVRGLAVERTFKLAEGVRVLGTVTGPDGKPVQGATLYAHYGYGGTSKATTDAQGRFLVQGLMPAADAKPPEKYQPKNEITASPPDDAPTLKSGTAPLPFVPAGGSAKLDIRLEQGVAISGQVKGPDGRPVPGCEISASHMTGRGSMVGYGGQRTDAMGRFHMMHLPPGQMFLNVQAPDDSGLVGKMTEERDYPAGKAATVDVVLGPGAAVFGKAMTSRGKPAVGTEITLQPKSGWPLTKARSAVVGATGSFRIDAVIPGKYEANCTPLDPALRAEPVALDVALGESKLDILLHVTGSVAGTIRDADGKPLGQGMAYLQLQSAAQPQGAGGYGHPDDQGRYRIGGLVPGSYKVIVNVGPRGQAKGLAAPAPTQVIVEEGKEAKLDVTVPAKGAAPPRKAEF